MQSPKGTDKDPPYIWIFTIQFTKSLKGFQREE